MDAYVATIMKDGEQSREYYLKSLTKTEQQKFLEELLARRDFDDVRVIGDLACGAGTLSYHLSSVFPHAEFVLSDLNPDALAEARRVLPEPKRFRFSQDDLCALPFSDGFFDLVFCWQTLSWIENPRAALGEIIRVLRPGGTAYLSSLFNIDFDVDLYTRTVDHTRESGRQGISYNYNTFSVRTIGEWLEGRAKDFEVLRFDPAVDFEFGGRGLGTFTLPTSSRRLQISGGMLMNWGVLVIDK
jgi:ubiquinone/menaquinone biosynthesis C-methylase UbiE